MKQNLDRVDENTTSELLQPFDRLYKYQYDIESEFWSKKWNSDFITFEGSESKILYFPKSLKNQQSILLLKTLEGIHFYQYDNGYFKLLSKSDAFDDNEFDDVYDWNKPGNVIKSGNFYHDQNLIGILTKHQEYGVKFYSVIAEELFAGEYPIWPLETDLSILGDIHNAEFYLSDLKNTGQENIIVRNKEGLKIYEFNKNNGLELLMQVPYAEKLHNLEENLFFPNLTGNSFKDILILNLSGLFVYQYRNEYENYGLIHYNTLFSEVKGWMSEYINSIRFGDVDLDGKQEMLFNGPRGIEILSFDNYTNQWQSLLNNIQFTIHERHEDIMRIISTNTSVTKFINVYNNNDLSNPEDLEAPVEEKTFGVNRAHPLIPKIVIPQIIHEEEKTIILLRDQIDYSTIFDAVDKSTGKIMFGLPLIDLVKLSSDIKFNLFYDGNSQVSGVLGLGWSIPQNFIIMDHQSSIFPVDIKYYVISENLPQLLIFDANNSTENIYRFKLANNHNKMQINYHKKEEKWEIHSKSGKYIYGRTHGVNVDPINWELTWEHWRGVGSSLIGQKKLATAWYLAEVIDKDENIIRYTYDVLNIPVSNGQSYTREIYLKTISDNKGTKITFNYLDKDNSEYDHTPVLDKDGNFNTRKIETRYLSSYKVISVNYQQNINFVYSVKAGKRFLNEVKQDGDPIIKPILQFTYKEMTKIHVLEKVNLPTGATVEFRYQSIGSKSAMNDNLGKRYDVQKDYRVDYGIDYVLISYINEQQQVSLRMFNHDMTKELYSSVSSTISSRFPVLGRGSVKSHEIVDSEEFFAVILHYNTDKELYLFKKYENKWLSTPNHYNFNEDSIFKFGKDFIVVANPNYTVELIDLDKISNEWTNKEIFKKDNVNLLIAASEKMFLIYDDQILFIWYRSSDNKWISKVIKNMSGVSTGLQNVLEKFGLGKNVHKHLLGYFKSNALQISTNVVLLSTLETEGPQLFTSIYLFILDKTYQLVQEQHFRIEQDNLDTFTREVGDSNNNKYILAYKVYKEKYKFTVTNIIGNMNDELGKNKKEALREIEDKKRKSLGEITAARQDLQMKAEKSRTELENRAREAKILFHDNVAQAKSFVDTRLKQEKSVVRSRIKKVKIDLQKRAQKVRDNVQEAKIELRTKVDKVKSEAFAEISKQAHKIVSEAHSQEEKDEIRIFEQNEKNKVVKQLKEEVSKLNSQLEKESDEAYRKLDEELKKATKQLEEKSDEAYRNLEDRKNKAYEQLQGKSHEGDAQEDWEKKIRDAHEGLEKQISEAYKQLEDGEKQVYKNVEDSRVDIFDQIRDIKANVSKNIAILWEKEFFLLDPLKYTVILDSNTAACRNTKLIFTGSSWKKEIITDSKLNQDVLSIPLGDQLIMNKENTQSTLQLYRQGSDRKRQGNSILDLEVKLLNQTVLRNMYPRYLAYQEKDKSVNIIEFSNGDTVDKTYQLPQEEQISPWSSYQILVTYINNIGEEYSKTLVFRNQLGIKSLFPNPVITSVAVSFDSNKKRLTGYEYNPSSAKVLGNSVYYEKSSVIPGNNKSAFGWIEEIKDLDNYSNAEKNIFNSQGQLVKTFKLKKQHADINDKVTDKENLYLNSSLLDKTGRLEVVQFYPYEIAEEEVGYYGFEDYEINIIEPNNSTNERGWMFNENDVVKHKFSFTGQNHLKLSNSILKGTFQPNNQNQQYVASCWIRSQGKNYELGAITPYLKAVVYSGNGDEIFGILSEVKLQSGNWLYLEVVIDLMYAGQVYKSLKANSSLTEKTANMNLKTSIIVSSGTGVTIDVDHVRFSPLNNNFKVNVYDYKTKQVQETIRADGLVVRHIYNEYQEKIATVGEYGQLESLSTYTKASSVGRIVQLKSNILIEPEIGFYEDFSPNSFQERWTLDNVDSWGISTGQIQHFSNHMHTLKLKLYDDFISHGILLCYSMQSEISTLIFNNDFKLIRSVNKADVVIFGKQLPVPLSGELLIIIENERLLIWIDGGFYYDGPANGITFTFGVSGKVKISNVLIFSEPSIRVTYFNELDEKVQEVVLENDNSTIVTGYLYDELGRQTITTEPARIFRASSQTLLAYYPNFIINNNPNSENSVWKTGEIQGNLAEIRGKYSYSQIKYNDNPLNEKCAEALPGKEFSITSTYAKRFAYSTQNLFINNLFPTSQNYSHQVEYKNGGIEHISVLDNNNNKVAWYSHVPDSKNVLSTYEYDKNGKLVKILPPLYHEKVNTLKKLNLNLKSLTAEEKILQDSLGSHTTYDEKGNLISKQTPDNGKEEYIYNKNGLLKFIVHHSQVNDQIENIVYFDYDQIGRLSSTGKLSPPFPKKEELLAIELSNKNAKEYQQFYHSDSEREPILRGKLKRTITFNNDEPLIEESVLDVGQETLSKRVLVPIKDDAPLSVAINKKYTLGKLKEIEYPINVNGKPFKLRYSYNKLGKVIGIGIPNNDNIFGSFTYNSKGQIFKEQHLPESQNKFTRQYNYNSPGFLSAVQDKFLTEKVYYTKKGYDGHGYSDGTVTHTEFTANWHEYCNKNDFGLNEYSFVSENITPEESKLCFNKLKETGYLDEHNHQAKSYYPTIEQKLPNICINGITGRQIAEILGKKGFPTRYGHSYAYGNHQELTKAKYFVGNDVPLPLQPDTFEKEINGMNRTVSRDIWRILKKSRFIIEDIDKADESHYYGKKGKSFIRETLFQDLKSIDIDYGKYILPLEKLMTTYFSDRLDLSSMKSKLKNDLMQWYNGHNTIELQGATNKIVEMLVGKHYLANPLHDEFNNILIKYKSFLPEIVQVLSKYFAKQLGEAEFDVESYNIDANGNHKHFYTGFDRYELSYNHNTNQVESVKYKSFASSKPEHNFAMKHDSRGNVIQALHKNIEQINYDPVSNHATEVRLSNGNIVLFYYDAQGERILKRVADSKGKITKEVHYIRDEFGRVLVERQIIYIANNLPPDVLVTAYIYGPKGLFGFIRRDEFYSVITDHEGSIRLVVKGDEVVAAYDYLPYGNLMRYYGNNPEAHIAYRYTGQEWDEELGLYNYHARFYDPSIGRFNQIDPKEQYFSTYKYAGNSPVSMIDPDGELAWFILVPLMVGLGAGGAYLGGAAANKDWNPGKWNWKSGKTWLGIIGGGVGGALLPVGFGASVSAFTAMGLSSTAAISLTTGLGVGGTYLSMAASNNDWNPGKWNFSSPETWNAAFQGFSVGSGAAGGLNFARTFYRGLSTFGKSAFLLGNAATGSGLFVLNGFANNWDFKKPGVYFGFVDAFTGAPDLPMFFRGASRFLGKNGRSIINSFDSFKSLNNQRGRYLGGTVFSNLKQAFRGIDASESLKRLASKQVWKNTGSFLGDLSSHEFSKSTGNILGSVTFAASSAIFMGNAVNENGDLPSAFTYHAMINGILMAGQFSSTGKAFYKRRQQVNPLSNIAKPIAEKAVKIYQNLLEVDDTGKVKWRFLGNSNAQQHYSAAVRAKIEEGNIPNAALSVAVTKKMVAAAFSGNESPALILYFDLDQKMQFSVLQEKNSRIGGRDVVLNDNREINGNIELLIRNKKDDIKQNNLNEFDTVLKDKLEQLISRKSAEIPSLTESRVKSMITDLGNELQVEGYINGRDEVAKILQGTLTKINAKTKVNKFEKDINKLKANQGGKITELENKITSLEKELGFENIHNEQTLSGAERIDSLKQRVEVIKQEKEQILNDIGALATKRNPNLPSSSTQDGRSIIDIVWNDYCKQFRDRFTLWNPTNCAEPHVLTALSRSPDIFSHSKSSFNYGLQDIKFLATYKLDNLPELTPFPRCDHCEITTALVKNVITDPKWSEKVQILTAKVESAKSKLYFLVPYFDMTNRYAQIDVNRDLDDFMPNRHIKPIFEKNI